MIRARGKRALGVLRRGGHRPVLAQEAQAGHREDQVVGELVEGALDAEVGAEGEREDGRVRGQVAAGVVAHQEHGAGLGNVAEPPDLAAEPQAGQQPEPRQALADVVGIALVEVGAGYARLDLLAHAGHEPGGEAARRLVVARGAMAVVARRWGDSGFAHQGRSLDDLLHDPVRG